MSGRSSIVVLHALTEDSLENVVVRDLLLTDLLRKYGDLVYLNILSFKTDSLMTKFSLLLVSDSVMTRRSSPWWRSIENRILALAQKSDHVAIFVQDDHQFPDEVCQLARKTSAVIFTRLGNVEEIYDGKGYRCHDWPRALSDVDIRRKFRQMVVPWRNRTFDLVARSTRTGPRHGLAGRVKSEAVELVATAAEREGLRVDVSTRQLDFKTGADWWRFLSNSRYTVSRLGGSSRIIRNRHVATFAAAIEQVMDKAPFVDQLKVFNLVSRESRPLLNVSPRFIESAGLNVVQIMHEEGLDADLQPWIHFVPLAKDYSNTPLIVQFMKSNVVPNEIIKAAENHFLNSKKYDAGVWYAKFASFFGLTERPTDDLGIAIVSDLELSRNDFVQERRSRLRIHNEDLSFNWLRTAARQYEIPATAILFPWRSVPTGPLRGQAIGIDGRKTIKSLETPGLEV